MGTARTAVDVTPAFDSGLSQQRVKERCEPAIPRRRAAGGPDEPREALRDEHRQLLLRGFGDEVEDAGCPHSDLNIAEERGGNLVRLSLELGMEEKVLPLPTWNTLTPVPAQSEPISVEV